MRIDHLNRLDGVQEGVHDALTLGIRRPPDVPAHGFRIKVSAVVKLHPLAQMEDIDLAVLLSLPRFSQLGDEV